MRGISLLLLGATLASCSDTMMEPAPPPTPNPAAANLLADRIAGRPQNCLPNYNANDMTVVDGRNVAFRVGGTTYLMQLGEGCERLAQTGYTMVTRQHGGSGLCHGDIVQVVDTTGSMTVGSCIIGDIVPYMRPR